MTWQAKDAISESYNCFSIIFFLHLSTWEKFEETVRPQINILSLFTQPLTMAFKHQKKTKQVTQQLLICTSTCSQKKLQIPGIL